MKGKKYEYTSTINNGYIDYKGFTLLHYAVIPFLGKYYLDRENFMYVSGGTYFGFLIQAHSQSKASTIQNGIITNSTFSKGSVHNGFYKFIDIGINAGVGLQWVSGLNTRLTYSKGFTNINNNTNPGKLTNLVIQLSIGYVFKYRQKSVKKI